MTTVTIVGSIAFWLTGLMDVASTRAAINAGKVERFLSVRAVVSALAFLVRLVNRLPFVSLPVPDPKRPSTAVLVVVKAVGLGAMLGLLHVLRAEIPDFPAWAEALAWAMPCGGALYAARRNRRLVASVVVLALCLALPASAQQEPTLAQISELADAMADQAALDGANLVRLAQWVKGQGERVRTLERSVHELCAELMYLTETEPCSGALARAREMRAEPSG